MAAHDQIQISVARQIGGAGTGRTLHGEHLAALHAEALGSPPEDEASIRCDLRHEQIQPSIVVEVCQIDPAGLFVQDAVVLHADTLRVGRVKTVGRTVENQQLRIVESTEDQVQNPVAIQIRTTDPVRPGRREPPIGFIGKSVRPVQEHVRSGIAAGRVFGRIGQHQIHVPIVVHITADGLDGTPSGHIPSPRC